MAILDAEILAVRLFTVCFNVFDRWHQRRCVNVRLKTASLIQHTKPN